MSVFGAAFVAIKLCGWWRYLKHGALVPALLVASLGTAWGEGQQFTITTPGVSPCKMYWDQFSSAFNVYLKNSKTGTYIKVGTVTNSVPGTPSPLSFPCPLTPGQYYWTVRGIGPTGDEGPSEVAFVIADPSSPTFQIGAAVKTTAYLNVRTGPGATQPLAGPPQMKGSAGTLMNGPVTVDGQRWWSVMYTSGLTGWSSELYLVAVVPVNAWVKCADEAGAGQPATVCNVPVAGSVRFGVTDASGDRYTVKQNVQPGPIPCATSAFTDPAVGTLKHCDYRAP